MTDYVKLVNGQPVPMTPDEIAARQAEEAQAEAAHAALAAQGIQTQLIQTLLHDLSAIFDAQAVELRARFAPLRAAVRLELELGHMDVARKIIELAEIPAELEALREGLLACFPASP